MGLYWMSVFRNKTTTLTLSAICKLIDDEDVKRGYVRKEELLQLYDDLIKPEDIDDQSYIEDYELNTYDFVSHLILSLPVR